MQFFSVRLQFEINTFVLFSLKDSILIESSSQSALSQSSTEKKLNVFTVMNIFDDTQVFRLFSEGKLLN
jgi:hypothetical protein